MTAGAFAGIAVSLTASHNNSPRISQTDGFF
jgi:hypothetical protein